MTNRHRGTILIVDDERAIVSNIANNLQLENYKTYKTYNTREALTAIKNQKIDVIITDIRMPGASGALLAAEIKSIDPTLQIIGISGYSDYTEEELFFKGIDVFFPKPFNINNLISIVDSFVENRQAIETDVDFELECG